MTKTPERLADDLAYLRDTCIAAIHSYNLGVLEDGLNVYHELITTFLDEIDRTGSRYSREIATRELSSISSLDLGWLEMEWLESGYQAVLDAALDSENWDLIRDVGYLSIRAAGVAVRHADYYVFHRFLKWLPYMYSRSQAMTDQRTKAAVGERCGRYLQEAISFLVAPFFSEPDVGPPIGALSDYVFGIENVFGDLMKQAVEYFEPRDYCHFSHQLAQGLDSLRYSLPDDDEYELDWKLSLPELSLAIRQTLERRLDEVRAINEVRHRLETTSRLLSLATLAWLLETHPDIDSDSWHAFRSCADIPEDAKSLWSLYVEARKNAVAEDLGWSRWELGRYPEGQVHALAYDYFIARAVLLLMLESPLNVDTVLETPYELHFILEGDGDVGRVLTELEGDARWRALIDGQFHEQIQLLRGLVARSAEAAKATMTDQLLTAPISGDRLTEVVGRVRSGWKEMAAFRELCTDTKAFERINSERPSDMPPFGLKRWDLKEIYVEITGSILVTAGWGEEYGRLMARGEDDTVLKVLLGADQSMRSIDAAALLPALDDWISGLEDSSRVAIVVVGSWISRQEILSSTHFNSATHSLWDASADFGRYRNVRVINAHFSSWTGCILIDIPASLMWTQYDPPPSDEGTTEIIDGQLAFNLRTFTLDEARKLVVENEGLRNWRGKTLPAEDAAHELQQHVHVSLLEAFKVELLSTAQLKLLALPD